MLDQIIEGFFWLDLMLSFLQEYRDQDTYKVVRSFRLIAKRYIFRYTIILFTNNNNKIVVPSSWTSQRCSL